jgi:hypothetical protein
MAALTAAGPVLFHFFDFAQLNSVRTIPYLREWHRRYANAGLTVLGVHSPRFPFTKTNEALAAGVERLGLSYPVAQDSSYAIWHDYGVKGWPSLFLWNTSGALAWFHFGEGEYRATEEAIQEELRSGEALIELPEPMEPVRPTDAPGAMVVPPTDETFPGGGAGSPWRPGDGPIRVGYGAAGAYAAVSGTGELSVCVDDGEAVVHSISGPALQPLAEHPHHEEHALAIEGEGGIEVYSIAFAAGLPG